MQLMNLRCVMKLVPFATLFQIPDFAEKGSDQARVASCLQALEQMPCSRWPSQSPSYVLEENVIALSDEGPPVITKARVSCQSQ